MDTVTAVKSTVCAGERKSNKIKIKTEILVGRRADLRLDET